MAVNATDGIVKILSRQPPLVPDRRDDDADVDFSITHALPSARTTCADGPRVVHLDCVAATDVPTAGGKGASLGALTRMSLRVPPGFVILTTAFADFLAHSQLAMRIGDLLHSICDHRSLARNSDLIQRAILGAELPPRIATEIENAFLLLATRHVAVRSSATMEDAVSASWAGQLESYLNTTHAHLAVNVQRCWASLFSERALAYRKHCEIGTGTFDTAVVVQQMVDSRVSGTAFSLNPVTGDTRVIFVECCIGLGETLVLGRETPASYVVAKDTFSIVQRNPGAQRSGIRRAQSGCGNESYNLSELEVAKALPSDDEICEVARIVARIETLVGFAVDVEWAFEGECLYVLQSRPVTGVFS